MPIMISLIAPPLYVMTTNALQESEGIAVLTRAIEKLNETIKEYGGNLVVKTQVRVFIDYDCSLVVLRSRRMLTWRD